MKGFLHIIIDGKVVYFSSMDIDQLRAICAQLPAVTEDVKWDHDLVFSVGGKMFCVASLEPPFTCSFKVADEEFETLSSQDGFEPAPYMARAKWVLVNKPGKMNKKEWARRVGESYEMVKQKLTKKARTELGIL
jgi:predicted DNA-binding protein (MmcQ/YjbR family)